MKEILFSLRMLLLLFSLYGCIRFLSRYFRIEFCFGICFSLVGSTLFLAGMLNLLREAAWAIFLLGLFLAGRSVKQKQSARVLLCPGVAFFLGMGVVLLFLLRGSIFTGYDSFSHWGLVAKILTRFDRFPNFSDRNVMFDSYPLGSASFIYFISEILGNSSEWVMMYAQAMLMVGMLVSLFPFARGWLQSLAALVCALFLLCGNNSFFDLLVDSLLPIVALSGLAVCTYEGDKLSEKLWVLIPYSVFLVSIKNSGALFVVFLLGCAWLLLPERRRSLKTWLPLLAVPVAVLFLWQKHVSMVFVEGLMSKHSMSPRYLYNMLERKTLADLGSIIAAMAKAVFTLTNPALWMLLFGLLLYLAARRLELGKKPGQLLLVAAVSYVCYQIGTLGMYILSMPLDEALRLASYSRYHQSILMFTAGLFFLETLTVVNALPEVRWSKMLRPAVTAVMLVLCFQSIHPHSGFFHRQNSVGSERAKFDNLMEEYNIKADGTYLILVQDERNDYGYLDHMTMYLLNPRQFLVLKESQLETAQTDDFNYVIAFEQSEEIDAFMAELGAEDRPVVCLSLPEDN